MSETLVLVEKSAGIATVTLNRPEALNALSRALREQVSLTFVALAKDPAVEVVVLTGAGRAFSVGLDLKELAGEVAVPESNSSVDLSDAIARFDRPIIGAINGFAITGGFEMALMCDFLIASSEARFADTHARVGVVPGWGLSQRLPRLIGMNRAKELSLTGNFLNAEMAEAWGLVNRVVAPADLLPTCQQLASDITSTEPVTRAEIKRIMDAGWESTLEQGLLIEKKATLAHASSTPAKEMLSDRRSDIQQRGREQSG